MSEETYLRGVQAARRRIDARRALRELEDLPLRDFASPEALFEEIDRRKDAMRKALRSGSSEGVSPRPLALA